MSLPKHWQSVPLGTVATFAPKKPLHLKDSDEPCSFIPMASVEEESGVIHLDQTIEIREGLKRSLTYFNEGDVLFAKVTPCMENGKIAVAKNLLNSCGFGSSEFHVITPEATLDADYLRYFLVSEDFRTNAAMAMTGAVGLRRVPKTYLQEHLIPLPPLYEQRLIVETLDEQLSRLDKALAELERSKRLTDNFKESLVHGVVSGQYSDELSNWQMTTLGQVAKWSSGGTPQSGNPNYYGGQIPWCVIGDLTESLVTETAKSITDEGLAASSAKIVNPGTVLLAMYGASIGRTGIAGKSMATNQAIACAVPNANLDPNYLLLYLQSQKRMFIESGKGGAQPNISQTIIKDWALNLPPLDEQKRLLDLTRSHQSTIASLNERALELESQYRSLRRSLLNAAFTGDLVA